MEKHKPSQEEIEKAEEMMMDEEKKTSRERSEDEDELRLTRLQEMIEAVKYVLGKE